MDSWGAPVSAMAAMSAAPAAASQGPLTSATFWSCDADVPMACPGGPTQIFTVPSNRPVAPTNMPGPGPQPMMTSVVVAAVPSQTGGQLPIQTAGAPPARAMSLKTSVGLLVGAALALFNVA